MYFTFKLFIVIVTQCEIWLYPRILSFFRGQIEREYVIFKQILVFHFVKYRFHIFFCEFGVGHADYGLEVISCENGALFFYISKFLIFNMNLTWRFLPVTWTQPEIVRVKLSAKRTWSKRYLRSLICFLRTIRCSLIIGELFIAYNLGVFVENPSVAWSSIE